MLQQVNLYQDALKKQKLRYSASTLLQLILSVIIVMSLFTAYAWYELEQNRQEFAQLQTKQQQVMARLEKIQAELALRKKDARIAQLLQDKERELKNKQKVLNILSRDEFGNTRGFIGQMTGLARQRIEGLWLTRVRIANGGTDVALYGTTYRASLLPRYLQRLTAEKSFIGTEFESMLLARQEKKTSWLDFSLQNIKNDGVQ